MDFYQSDLASVPGHRFPALLKKFALWLAKQEWGSLGYFHLHTLPSPANWCANPDTTARLIADGYSFLSTSDGSLLLMLKPNTRRSPAIVLLGSEGGTATVATSLEEFLHLLAKGETGIHNMDCEDATGRAKLRRWLTQNSVPNRRGQPFDFEEYLDGTPSKPPPSAGTLDTAPVAGLSPAFGELVSMVGRRVDDPELARFVEKRLGKSVGQRAQGGRYIVARKQGIELGFSDDVLHESYPRVPKSKSTYMSYLNIAWLYKEFKGELPFGLRFGMTAEALTKLLGAPHFQRLKFAIPQTQETQPIWRVPVDPRRSLALEVTPEQVSIQIEVARELARWGETSLTAMVGAVLAWVVSHDLLDETRFAPHRSLVDSIRKRKLQGSSLQTVISRGVWDVHLKDLPGLREFAWKWFHDQDRVRVEVVPRSRCRLCQPRLQPGVRGATRPLRTPRTNTRRRHVGRRGPDHAAPRQALC